MSARRCMAAALVAVVAAACTRDPPRTGDHLLFPVHRMVDAPPPTTPAGLAWNEFVRIAGEERPSIATALTGSQAIAAVRGDAGSTRWSVPLPPALARAGWLLVQSAFQEPGGALRELPARFVSPATVGPVVHVDAADATGPGAVVALVTPVPALDACGAVGRTFTVPEGAVLALGLGVEERAWTADAAPAELRVAIVEDGHETVVRRAVLDPSRRVEDRRWTDVRVDLARFAGRTVALALRCGPADAGRPGTSLVVWSDPVVLAPGPTHALNVILISLDTLRAKSVSAYGASRPTTPQLDRLVGEAGTVFDFAYTTAPHTLPAHMSTFTGLFVRGLMGVNPITPLRAEVSTLPERLRAAGWETGAVTEDGFVIPRLGFRRGFASYRENTSPDSHEPLGHSAKTFRHAAAWLAARRDRPTFLFVHTYEVHFPYTPAPPYDAAFASADDVADDVNALELLRYEQEARYLDDELRAFLDAVDALGLRARRTLRRGRT